MKRRNRSLTALVAGLTLASALPAAQDCPGRGGGGGGYPGPGDGVPPLADPPVRRGPTTPGPAAPAPEVPATPAGQPQVPIGSQTPTGVPGVPAATTPRSLLEASDRSGWWHWWEYHRELYLDLDETLARLHPRTPADGDITPLLGRRQGLSAEVVYGRIVPSLLRALETSSGDPRLVRQSLLALGRVGEAPHDVAAPRLVDAITPFLADGRMGVFEGATIALGALASPEAVVHLRGLLLDDVGGRVLADRKRVPVRVRALAAYGLGVSGGMEAPPAVRRYAVHALAEALGSDVARYPDVQAAAVIALGLVPVDGLAGPHGSDLPPGAGLDAQVLHLAGLLADEDGPDMVRTHAPTALARLLRVDPSGTASLRASVVHTLLDLTHPRSRARVGLRRSAAVALGEIADSDLDPLDVAVRARLIDLMRKGDLPTRRFATMALARAAGRGGTGDQPLAGAAQATDVLRRELARGKDRAKPWAGLALGVLAYHLRAQDEAVAPELVSTLLHALQSARQPLDAAALALGAGLARDARAFDAVRARVEDTSDPQALAHLTLALGLLRDRAGLHVLAAVMDDAGHQPAVMEAAALGRAMTADRGLVEDLVSRLDDCDCAVSTSGVCRGLAWAGDHHAVAPLIAMLEDGTLSSGTHANAVEALGRVADRSVVPWDVRISAGLNYLDAPTSLTDPTGFGILDSF